MRLPSIAVVLALASTYVLLLVAGTAHMSSAERAIALLPWKSDGAALTQLHVRFGDRVCEVDEVFVGDGVVRTGSRCIPQRREATHDEKHD